MNNTLKVLIVDDSSVIRERLVAILDTITNVEVTGQARDVTEAITMLNARRPDVVILDISLPDGNGFDVLQVMQQQATDAIVIMLTNYTDIQYRQHALQQGVHYFFDKSSEFGKVSETLQSLAASGDFDAGDSSDSS